MRPIIGITMNGQHEGEAASMFYQRLYASPALYTDAVRRAGGIPILLPPGDAHWRDALDMVDGVIFAGGADIAPSCYAGDNTHPSLTALDHERDTSEIAMAQYLVATDKPILAICRGMQVLNVALGGTMYPHIPDIRDEDIHRHQGAWVVHDIDVAGDSLLAEVMGATHVTTYSGHHQAVAELASDLYIVATAPDGIAEALAHTSHHWLVAVQWHPEKSAAEDPTQQSLFNSLVSEARK